jgi:hypothetical protein
LPVQHRLIEDQTLDNIIALLKRKVAAMQRGIEALEEAQGLTADLDEAFTKEAKSVDSKRSESMRKSWERRKADPRSPQS